MMDFSAWNPLAFRPRPVTFWLTVVYLVLVVPVFLVHLTVPPAPKTPPPVHTVAVNEGVVDIARTKPKLGGRAVDLNEAWLDLQRITLNFHPYNSHANDEVREYLLQRLGEILDANGASWTRKDWTTAAAAAAGGGAGSAGSMANAAAADVVVFNDRVANVTVESMQQSAHYFEGNNIYVYIRGTDDEPGAWWESGRYGKGGVLVNAHFDSVSTGFGATDDGVGVVTVMQLIRHFTTHGKQPKRGIVALLNNAEEDFLWGARAFGASSVEPFCRVFLNLDGAGAGGRAILFRASDVDVVRRYSRSPHPFGTVVASEGFHAGIIRSQTDYVVFNGAYGQQGLDVAFYEPRSRYHTDFDDTRHTSYRSLWHMLSASVDTVKGLTASEIGAHALDNDGNKDKNKDQKDKAVLDTLGKRSSSGGKPGVWFDILGRFMPVFELHTLFAWSVTLLVASPLILLGVTYALVRVDKWYFFATDIRFPASADHEPPVVPLGAFRGLFRFPFAVVVASALVASVALLLRKMNPLIVYSSAYSVWATFFSLFVFAYWLVMRGASAMRPTALHRGYVFVWLYVLGWLLMVLLTVFENNYQVASVYPLVLVHGVVFLCLLISLCEQFALPSQYAFAQESLEAAQAEVDAAHTRPAEGDRATREDRSEEAEDADHEDGAHSERAPLLGGRQSRREDSGRRLPTFATTYRRSISFLRSGAQAAMRRSGYNGDGDDGEPRDKTLAEQKWSVSLPSWAWFLQLLLLAPIVIVPILQLGLLLSTSVSQTGPDGSSLMVPFAMIGLTCILVALPLMPFVHRMGPSIPVLLLVVAGATLVYNLFAFPFSAANRYKMYFAQTVDLDSGVSRVTLTGLERYVRPVFEALPSTTVSGREISCDRVPSYRAGLKTCSFEGKGMLLPRVGGHHGSSNDSGSSVSRGIGSGNSDPIDRLDPDLVSISVSKTGSRQATVRIHAPDTRNCALRFGDGNRLASFSVHGAAPADPRFAGQVADEEAERTGLKQVKLWRRDREVPWTVDIEFLPHEERGAEAGDAVSGGSFEGLVVCLWNNDNEKGVIPALDELWHYGPAWMAVTKASDGMVEVYKQFKV